MQYLIEGLDRLGKDTLINSILHKRGFHHVLHFSKPTVLETYSFGESTDPIEGKREALYQYQRASFWNMFTLLEAQRSSLICNRAHLGECVYAPMYRGYAGDYVFDLENQFNVKSMHMTRLLLLVENFAVSKHFADDGDSFDVTKREQEQELFIAAFERSKFGHKRIICVTADGGLFKDRRVILEEALSL